MLDIYFINKWWKAVLKSIYSTSDTSRRLLNVWSRTCHQTTYSCFCTQEFSWATLPCTRVNRCCNNCLWGNRYNIFSYLIRSLERMISWAESIPNQAAVYDPDTNRIGIFHCWRCAKDYNQSYLWIFGSSSAIVAIRAALTYLLNWELRDERERDDHREPRA